MITKNPMQLKAFIKKKAAEKNISAQLVMQNYMLERLPAGGVRCGTHSAERVAAAIRRTEPLRTL